MSINEKLGKRIRYLRESISLTQQELAEKVGVESPSYISKIERGQTSPSYELLARIAESLGVHLKDLFDEKMVTTKIKLGLRVIEWVKS